MDLVKAAGIDQGRLSHILAGKQHPVTVSNVKETFRSL